MTDPLGIHGRQASVNAMGLTLTGWITYDGPGDFIEAAFRRGPSVPIGSYRLDVTCPYEQLRFAEPSLHGTAKDITFTIPGLTHLEVDRSFEGTCTIAAAVVEQRLDPPRPATWKAQLRLNWPITEIGANGYAQRARQ